MHVRRLHERFAREHVALGGFLKLAQRLDLEITRGHAERSEDPLPDEVLIRLPGQHVDKVSRQRYHLVGVHERGAERCECLQIFEGPDHFLLVVGCSVDRLQIILRSSRAVAHEIPGSDIFRELLIVQPEPRDVFDDRSIPVQLALIRKHRQSQRSECLGDRADRKHRIPCHRQVLLYIPLSVAFDAYELAVLYQSNAHSGYVIVFH